MITREGVLEVHGPAVGLVGVMNLDKRVVSKCMLSVLQGYFWEEHRVDLFDCQDLAINTQCIEDWAKAKSTESFLSMW